MPDQGEIIHYYAVNRWDDEDEFEEWAKPSRPLTVEAERILGIANAQINGYRSTDLVLKEFLRRSA